MIISEKLKKKIINIYRKEKSLSTNCECQNVWTDKLIRTIALINNIKSLLAYEVEQNWMVQMTNF